MMMSQVCLSLHTSYKTSLDHVCVLCLCLLTRQEVALRVQHFLDVSDPDLFDVDVGGLQGETLRCAAARQDKLTGVVVHAVLQAQEGHLGRTGAASVRLSLFL